jgi:hypothetical protein
MTLIIGHRNGWMVADRRSRFGECVRPIDVSKIINIEGVALVAAAGNSGFGQLASTELASHGGDADVLIGSLSKYIRDNTPDINLLVVTRAGRLCIIDEKGVVYDFKPKQLWWALGSSDDMAIGWLACWERMMSGMDMPPDTAVRALEYCALMDVGVGDGFQMERL